jgi:hypothetical protein
MVYLEGIAMSLEERLTRLEALIQTLSERGGQASAPAARSTRSAPRQRRLEERDAGQAVSSLLERGRRPGRHMVVTGVGHWTTRSAATASTARIWDEGDPLEIDARQVAAVCQALASEARLNVLSELLPAARGTGE